VQDTLLPPLEGVGRGTASWTSPQVPKGASEQPLVGTWHRRNRSQTHQGCTETPCKCPLFLWIPLSTVVICTLKVSKRMKNNYRPKPLLPWPSCSFIYTPGRLAAPGSLYRPAPRRHRITESLRLEKTSKITKSNCQPITAMPTKPCPKVPYLHVF